MERPGVPIRIYFGHVTSVSRGQDVLPDGRTRVILKFRDNAVEFFGPSKEFCCPLGAWTIAEVAGQLVQVNGVDMPLDRPGRASGALNLRLAGVTAALPNAVIDIYPDSVVVHAREQDAR